MIHECRAVFQFKANNFVCITNNIEMTSNVLKVKNDLFALA